ncbi:MAG: signal peptidase I [Elusimicrobiales bacterium]|nr:signal peptidase I [Elusimicrobiales bacterium]
MEEKLFWIGILMGSHLLLSYYFKGKKKFSSKKFTRVWHSIFFAIIFFSGAVMLAVSLGNRQGEVVTAVLFSQKQIMYGLIAAVLAGLFVFWRSKKKKLDTKTVNKLIKSDMEWSETVFSAVILASVVMYLIIQAFKIPSGSMKSTFLINDHLFVNKFIYGIRIPYTNKKIFNFRKVKREDIIVFKFPSSNPKEIQCGGSQYGKDFIKRVIGLPGDKIQIKSGVVYINDKRVIDEPYAQFIDGFNRYPVSPDKIPNFEYQKYWQKRVLGKMFAEYVRDNFGPVKVPEGQYLVLGDNRDRSCDSRYWGPVPEHLIKGRAWFIYWPFSRMGVPK